MKDLYSTPSALLLLLALLLCGACTDNTALPDEVDSFFSKRERERLGNRIHLAALSASGYDLLPQIAPYDTSIYRLTNEWYSQLTTGIQRDLSSPLSTRWDKDRPWIVTIMETPQQIAVAAPGGYLYLSTGLLSALRWESELYALMALEAAAVQEEEALRSLITAFGAEPLRRLLRGEEGPSLPQPADLADWLFSYAHGEVVLRKLDEAAAELVCNSSLYAPQGLLSAQERLPASGWWGMNRSYPGRAADWADRDYTACGQRNTLGLYQESILPNLP